MTTFLGGVVDQTIMSTSDGGNKRVLNFSNPNISVSGRATGSTDHNNARRISETWWTVGNFKPNPSGMFGAYIEGPTLVSTAESRNFELVYSCGTAPYSFSWQYSYDGVNYYNANLNSDTYSVYFYETQQLFLKGTVTGNGQSYTAYTSVYAQIPGQGLRIGADETIVANADAVETYPNPVDDIVKIKYVLKTAQKVKVDMMDQSGRVISVLESGNTELSPGMHRHEWNAKNATTGGYLLRVQLMVKRRSSEFL